MGWMGLCLHLAVVDLSHGHTSGVSMARPSIAMGRGALLAYFGDDMLSFKLGMIMVFLFLKNLRTGCSLYERPASVHLSSSGMAIPRLVLETLRINIRGENVVEGKAHGQHSCISGLHREEDASRRWLTGSRVRKTPSL